MMISIIKNLKKEIITLLLCITIPSLFLISAYHWKRTSYENKNIVSSELKQLRHKYYTALNQKLLLDKYENQYEAFISLGVIGDENRLNWVDVLGNLTKKDKVPYLKYKINERQIISSQTLLQSFPGITLYKSTMIMNMQILHEGDLYSVLNSLDAEAKGLFDIQSCSIQRNPTEIESLIESDTDKNFSVNCILNWYTLGKQSFSESKTEDI